ncbi:hypothetical protein OH77DRAFT_564378 [Trametes cingulata]|nr:hypothetical protein OH77DRAFT_564378 [Trametes cingulata]
MQSDVDCGPAATPCRQVFDGSLARSVCTAGVSLLPKAAEMIDELRGTLRTDDRLFHAVPWNLGCFIGRRPALCYAFRMWQVDVDAVLPDSAMLRTVYPCECGTYKYCGENILRDVRRTAPRPLVLAESSPLSPELPRQALGGTSTYAYLQFEA